MKTCSAALTSMGSRMPSSATESAGWVGVGNETGWVMHLGRKDKDESVESESGALRATVDRLNSLPLVSLASHLMFGFQGTAADAHMTYVLTRYGVSVRDAGAVERLLAGSTSIDAIRARA